MNSKLPPSLPPSTLPGNSCETTKVMIALPLPNYPHKCAPISPLTNECGQRVTYNGNPILEKNLFFLLFLSSFFFLPPPLSPWDESEADRVTHTLNSPHPSDSQIPDPELNKTHTREEVKEMLKHLPPDKAAGPDGITNRIL